MTNEKRTVRDAVYINTLRRQGPLSIGQLAKEVSQNLAFRDLDINSIEKDLQRRASHYEKIGLLARNEGKLQLLQADPKYIGSPQPKSQAPLMLNTKGFLTGRAGVTCEHCGGLLILLRTLHTGESNPDYS
jgi:hypothetical protein